MYFPVIHVFIRNTTLPVRTELKVAEGGELNVGQVVGRVNKSRPADGGWRVCLWGQ